MFKLWKWIFHAFHSEDPAPFQGGMQPQMRPGEEPHYWRAIRMQGGGTITSPFEMQEWEALIWVSDQLKGQIAYVDREVGFIFYR